MKNILLLVIVVVAVSLLGWWFMSTAGQSNAVSEENVPAPTLATEANLLVLPQAGTETVVVQKTTLTEPGFLVLREVIEDTAAQIVEISPYLAAGTYTDITIPIGEFYTGDSELAVVIYADAKNDQTLNDLDQPYLDDEANAVAAFVTTGVSVPPEVFSQIKKSQPMNMGGMDAQIVRYTNSGFVPATLAVKPGSLVRFVNDSDTEMWVASDNHPAHTDLPTFDQFKASDSYSYVFEEIGEWAFHDHLNAAFTGTITVTN